MITFFQNFITQGYLFTALLLFFAYCFDNRHQPFYTNLIKTTNRLAGLFLLGYLLLMLISLLGFTIFIAWVEEPFLFESSGGWFLLFLHPYVLAFVLLAIPRLRHYRVWILLPVAILLNISFIGNMLYGDFSSVEHSTWEDSIPPLIRIVIFTTGFLALIVFLHFMTLRMKKEIKDADNKMPERV